MGIAYFDLDDEKVPVPVKKLPAVVVGESVPGLNLFEGETTECNYLVMAFIIGVLLLALTDSTRR